ncbi:MAG: hypothetical protein IJU66_06570 [Oscillospiraceae bacterium]|nr:hypothetical protein [Oscillospiraceae bacterium]
MAGKKKETAENVQMTRNDMIREYIAVYRMCLCEDPKSFDAKGALSALDQVGRLLGYDVPCGADAGGQVILRLSGEVGDRGD